MKVSATRPFLAGPVALAFLVVLLSPAQAATYSLAGHFSYTENGADSTWSYRLDDRANDPPAFPLLTLTSRDANAIWGSNFPTPPMMWSEDTGYWGIGKNLTGQEQFSSRNNTRWAPGEVLLHPKEGNLYHGLVGRSLWVSEDLERWEGRGEFLASTPFIRHDDDGACPNFEPIGDKHILLFFSHTNGGQYFLGDYADQKFKPYAHGRFNHGRVAPGGVHAPSAASDGKGGVINILNINDAKQSDDWDQIMSVPQHLTVGPDKLLRIEPIEALTSLRGEHRRVGRKVLAANEEIVLDQIQGNMLELAVELDPKEARWVQLNVLRSRNAEELTSITFLNFDRQLTYWYQTAGEVVLDGTRSSTLPDVWLRPPERAIMRRDGESLKLRVFIDRSVVEVFANGKQYLALRVYPGREDSVGVSVRAQGQDAVLNSLDAWKIQSIWP